MTDEMSSKIVDTLMSKTFDELSEYVQYIVAHTNGGGVDMILEFAMSRIPEITKKTAGELDDQEKLILIIYWIYGRKPGCDSKLTPKAIIENLTDQEIVDEFNRRLADRYSAVALEVNAIVKKREGL